MSEGWKYSTDGQEHGPVPLEEILRLLRAGAIGLRTPVSTREAPNWVPLSAVEPIREQVLAALKARAGATQPQPVQTAPVAVPAGKRAPDAAAEASLKARSDAPRYAGLGRRLAADTLDGVIVGGTLFVLAVGYQSWFGFAGEAGPRRLALVSAVGVAVLATWLYSAWMESSTEQGTAGKIVLDLKVTDLDGQRISFRQASLRFLAKLLSAMTLGAGLLTALFTGRRQTLHDLLARSIVVRG